MKPPENILLVDKPKSISSFDAIRRLRAKTGVRKFGHAGTLDPLASGLLIIGREAGTKLLTEYLKLPKEYVAEILIGVRTASGDLDGAVLESAEVPVLDEKNVRAVLAGMVGTLCLPVSAFSAIKKDGVPMYKRARKAAEEGRTIDDAPPRDMEVYEAELLHVDFLHEKRQAVVHARFFVGSGTYIRSLGVELGRRLGYPATLANLRRTKIGEFRVEDADPV